MDVKELKTFLFEKEKETGSLAVSPVDSISAFKEQTLLFKERSRLERSKLKYAIIKWFIIVGL